MLGGPGSGGRERDRPPAGGAGPRSVIYSTPVCAAQVRQAGEGVAGAAGMACRATGRFRAGDESTRCTGDQSYAPARGRGSPACAVCRGASVRGGVPGRCHEHGAHPGAVIWNPATRVFGCNSSGDRGWVPGRADRFRRLRHRVGGSGHGVGPSGSGAVPIVTPDASQAIASPVLGPQPSRRVGGALLLLRGRGASPADERIREADASRRPTLSLRRPVREGSIQDAPVLPGPLVRGQHFVDGALLGSRIIAAYRGPAGTRSQRSSAVQNSSYEPRARPNPPSERRCPQYWVCKDVGNNPICRSSEFAWVSRRGPALS